MTNDTCWTKGPTLTHYTSKYLKINFKLNGLDKFQNLRGFVHGLDNKYKEKVETQYTKTLEEIKFFLQFYDTSDK